MPRLNMCSEYVATIQRFVETRRAYEWGLVAQALAGAMRHVLQVGTAVASAPCCMYPDWQMGPLLS